MDTLLCEVRFAVDETRQSPGRLVGTLVNYEERANDRPEILARGSLHWPQEGLVINDQHDRKRAIVRTTPFLDGDALKVNARLPDTTAGRDAATNVREGVLTGLSVEMFVEQQARRGGLREIRRAYLPSAGLVDKGAYTGSKVEIRERRYWQLNQEVLRWL